VRPDQLEAGAVVVEANRFPAGGRMAGCAVHP
jgi:hypothetical protein